MSFVYMDNAATTHVDGEVYARMRPWLESEYGNPSSSHPPGLRAAEAIDEARRELARATGANADHVVFTSGGTEANNAAIFGLARACKARNTKGRHILIGPTEHPSIVAPARALESDGFEVEQGRLTTDGALDLADMQARLRPDTVLVAMMLANNELGTIYPVRALARSVRARSPQAAVHVDAVQAFGKLEVGIDELGADSIALSAHKFHGPKGIGALVTNGAELVPLLFGGGQEAGLRSGTENVPGIVGLGEAVRLAEKRREATQASMHAAREALRARIEALPGMSLLEPGVADAGVLHSVAALLVPGPPAEVWMHHLETHDVVVSAGSACKAKGKSVSPILLAAGLDADAARHVLRVSFSRETTLDDVQLVCAALESVCNELQVKG